ncbi:MAG: hypothetical protein K0S06_1907 [Microvirga sp.]|nr:hypothetical protein [Microvirga sp.]
MTGSMPGIAASTKATLLFGSAPNSVEAPEKSFASLVTWAWISMPTITSQSPVAPLISFERAVGGETGAFMVAVPEGLCGSKSDAARRSTLAVAAA